MCRYSKAVFCRPSPEHVGGPRLHGGVALCGCGPARAHLLLVQGWETPRQRAG